MLMCFNMMVQILKVFFLACSPADPSDRVHDDGCHGGHLCCVVLFIY